MPPNKFIVEWVDNEGKRRQRLFPFQIGVLVFIAGLSGAKLITWKAYNETN